MSMLEKLFIGILNMSLTAGIIIPFVMALRLLLRRAPKIFSYVLWAVVLFRLICPFSFSAAFSLLGVLDAPKTAGGQIAYISVNEGEMTLPAADTPPIAAAVQGTADLQGGAPDKMPAANRMQTALTAGSRIWLLGVLALLVYSVASLAGLKRKLKSAEHERGNIYTKENLETPFVCGIFLPKIYLPKAFAGEERAYILLHEQTHIRRGDHLVKAFFWLALCVHWFNPLVWAAFFLCGRDMEMSCDEAVIRKMGSGVKKEYSASLLNLATGRQIVGGVPLAFGEGDTGSRIQNVLRYKKPAIAILCIAALATAAVGVVLIANPSKRGAQDEKNLADGETQTVPEALYGVVEEYDGRHVVVIPVLGVVELHADEIETYFEPGEDGQDLREGDLVELLFAPGADVLVRETFPATFSEPVEHVYIMRRGVALSYEGEDRYRISFPIEGPAVIGGEEVEAGDMLQIYRTDVYGEDEEPWRMVPVLEVDKEKNQATIELSAEDTKIFLAEISYTMSRVYIKAQDEGGNALPENSGSEEDGGADKAGGENGGAGGSQKEAVTGTVYFSELSKKEPMTIALYSLYMDTGEQLADKGESLVFAEDCVYKVNTAMETVNYREVSCEEFIDTLPRRENGVYDGVRITLIDNVIVEAAVMSPLCMYGIEYVPKPADPIYSYYTQEVYGEDMLERYYTLVGTEIFDVADSAGDEQIEIYIGDAGDGDSGWVLFRDASGSLLHSEFAHVARVDWNNVYLGEIDGTGFIMGVHIEDRYDTGAYRYWVYRLSAEGEIRLIASSLFEWGLATEYRDDLLKEWVAPMTYYLEHSRLILSTQDGEIRTEQISEADKYNYETLSLKDRKLEEIP